MLLSLYHDKPSSTQAAETFTKENVLERLKLLDARARRKGLESIDPARNPLIGLGMEVDQGGHVTKNSYGVFNLSWQAAEHPEWPETIMGELAGIRQGIRDVHKVPLRYLIWAGMGGSAEDKAAYNAIGLLKRGPRVYILDSTDPVKMQSILDDIQRRSGGGLADALKTTLVVGMALGMTSYEPVVNLEKLAALFEKHKIDSRPNFVYMTLPDSLLDQFGRKQGYRKVEMQLDNANGTSGRHSAPLTRGSLYPLGLASVDLAAWMAATNLGPEEIQQAWRLAAFLNTQATSGRNKIVLLLPKEWSGIGIWTKQNFEESLGKREDFGLKIVVEEKPKLARYRAPKEAGQDRAFLAVQIKGSPHGDAQKVAALRRAGYPMASVTLAAPELSRYMQFIHYTVFGVAYLQNMNFVTQPGVELYKEITNKLHSESEDAGGIEKTAEWQNMLSSPRRARWRNAITLYYDRLPGMAEVEGGDAAAAYAFLLKYYGERKQMEYGELTFFGDTRYSPSGRALRKILDRGGERIFKSALRMPVDVYEGPAMNHSYHEMIIGHGRCLSTVILSEKGEKLAAIDHTPDYHRAQFLATQMALAQRARLVVALTVKDLEKSSLALLDEFFIQTAALLKARKGR